VPEDPITRGDDATLTVTIRDTEGDPYPLAGKTLWFTAKKKLSDPDEVAVISKTTGEGIELLGGTGQAVVRIDAADTANLPNKDTTLHCDVQMLDGGKVWTVVKDTLIVEPDVTRRSS
jgi:hypothetical protein